jgi:TRAP-type C4-dicarboxylate transport system permease small subunit
MLEKLTGHVASVSRWAAWAGGAAMMAAAFIVTVDVLLRKFAGLTMSGADELSGYIFAIATAWTFSYAILERANVRIDGLYLLAPTPLRAVMDIAALAALGIFVAAMLHSGWVLWLDNFEYDSRSITPWRTRLWIPQTLWMIGWAWMALTLALLLVRCLLATAKGDLPGVVAIAGVRSADEEVREEIAHAKEELEHERALRARSGER